MPSKWTRFSSKLESRVYRYLKFGAFEGWTAQDEWTLLKLRLCEWYSWTYQDVEALSWRQIQEILAIRGADSRIKSEKVAKAKRKRGR